MDPTYQNAVIKVFTDCITVGLCFEHSTYQIYRAYKGIMAGDPMRKLLLDFWIWIADESWDASDIIDNAGKDFTQELLAALLAKRTHPGWFGKIGTSGYGLILIPKERTTLRYLMARRA